MSSAQLDVAHRETVVMAVVIVVERFVAMPVGVVVAVIGRNRHWGVPWWVSEGGYGALVGVGEKAPVLVGGGPSVAVPGRLYVTASVAVPSVVSASASRST